MYNLLLIVRLSACLSACCLCTLPRFTPLISTRGVYRPFLPTRRLQKRTSLQHVPRGAGFIESRSELAAVASPVAALQCATRKAPAQPPTGSEPVTTNTLASLQNLPAKRLYREQLRALLAGSREKISKTGSKRGVCVVCRSIVERASPGCPRRLLRALSEGLC